MAWDYDYQAGPPGGTLEALSDYCTFVRIIGETVAGRRGQNPVVQYRHGEYPAPRKFVRASSMMLETGLRYTGPSGTITDPDGAAGHVYANKAAMGRLLGAQAGQLVRIHRTAPHQGAQYKDVELLEQATPTQSRSIFGWPLHSPHPFWMGPEDLANVPPTLTVEGDAPIGNATIRLIDPATDAKLVVDSTGDFVQIVGALPAGGVTIDVASATATRITGGADWSNALRMSSAWELNPGANAVTLTGGGTCQVDWRTQWR